MAAEVVQGRVVLEEVADAFWDVDAGGEGGTCHVLCTVRVHVANEQVLEATF